MAIHRFRLQGEFIELNVLLKLLALAPSGGAAKALVAGRAVAVDGQIETRVRRKLRAGNTVRVADEEIRVLAADGRLDIAASAAAAGPPQGGAAKDTEPRQRRTTVIGFREGEGGVSRSTGPRRRSRRAVQSPPRGAAGRKAIQ